MTESEKYPGQHDWIRSFIEERIPKVADRTLNDPMYLVNSKNSIPIFDCLKVILLGDEDDGKSINEFVNSEETRDLVRTKLSEYAQYAGWSEVRITGMQILFIANIKVISNDMYDKIIELCNEPAAPKQALIDLMNGPRRYTLE